LHGFNLQFGDMMYFVHFQFDKMLIAAYVGLGEVSHYECASRAVQALRSIPGFGLGSFLPTATEKYSSKQDFWPVYLDLTRVAMLSTIFLLLLPMAISPLFLFAWVGQIGYHGRWVFMLLAAGVSISVITMPVNLFIQAMGRTVVMAKLAIVSIVINVVLSFLLVQVWGKEGAAAGTALAVSITGGMYLFDFHASNKKKIIETISMIIRIMWPALAICVVSFGLERFIEPWVISSRWYMAPASVCIYLLGVIMILYIFAATGRFGAIELRLINKVPFVNKWISGLNTHG
jgi:O-antigen/teichoic acid export membrane protein